MGRTRMVGGLSGMILVVVAGTLLATGSFSSSTSQPATAGSIAVGSLAARSAAGAAIVAVLERYQHDYSSSNLHDLADLFTPGVMRHGFGSHGCATVHGKRAVLAQYSAQFTKDGRKDYFLVGLGPSTVALGQRDTAQVDTIYRIPAEYHDTGPISFT